MDPEQYKADADLQRYSERFLDTVNEAWPVRALSKHGGGDTRELLSTVLLVC